MKPLLKTTLLASALAGAMLIGGTAYATSAAAPSHVKVKAKAPVQLLFVLSAKSGDIARSGQDYRLTLNTVDRHVLWFTDRPNRKAGFVPLTHFLASWTKGFANSPPNGALVHVGMEAKIAGKNQPMAMELSKPSYHNGQLSFKVTALKGDHVMVGRYNDLKLFFDMPKLNCKFGAPHSELACMEVENRPFQSKNGGFPIPGETNTLDGQETK